MKLRQSANINIKTKLSTTLRSWLPILQSGIEELEERIREYEKERGIKSRLVEEESDIQEDLKSAESLEETNEEKKEESSKESKE
ncbi:MAG: hypothetical protein L3J42_02655 [Hydrogenimonas sp.]|nr:hypothetical protein [Hydrogenimonas sp.]